MTNNPATYKLNTVGCNVCYENECYHPVCASFDANGNILVPSGGKYWANTSAPTHIHTTPCAFQVTIGGVQNYSVQESWCRSCVRLNGNYISRNYTILDGSPSHFYGTYNIQNTDIEPWRSDRTIQLDRYKIADVPLCDYQNYQSVCGLGQLDVFLVVGPDEGLNGNRGFLNLVNDRLTPSGISSMVYKYGDSNQSPAIPTRYIWAVANLRFDERTNVNCQCGLYHGYWFKTKLQEFKGDYVKDSASNWQPVVPMIVAEGTYFGYDKCGDKYYHGDFDGRQMTFTVNGSDLVVDPENNGEVTAIPELCNFNGMSIRVSPYDNYSVSDISANPGSSHASPIVSGVLVTYEVCSKLEYTLSRGEEWDKYIVADPVPYGKALLPQSITVTIDGVVSTNPAVAASANIHTCNDCELLNTVHVLHHDGGVDSSLDSNNKYYEKYVKTFEAFTPNAEDDTLCCNCPDEDICIHSIEVTLERINGDLFLIVRIRSSNTSLGSNNILATYRYSFNTNRVIHKDRITGPVTLGYYSSNLDFSNKCAFSNATVVVDFNIETDADQINCADPLYLCSYCKDTAPTNVLVNVPNGFTVNTGLTVCGDCDNAQPEGGEFLLDMACLTVGYLPLRPGCTWIFEDPSDCRPECIDISAVLSGACTWEEYLCTARECRAVYQIGLSIFPNNALGSSIFLGQFNGVWLPGPNYWDNAVCFHLVIWCYDYPITTCMGEFHFGNGYPLSNWGTKLKCNEWTSNKIDFRCNENPKLCCDEDPNLTNTAIFGGAYIDCSFNNLHLAYIGQTHGFDCRLVAGGCQPWLSWNGSSVTISGL